MASEALAARALPTLAELSGARAALLLRHSPDGPVVAAAVGAGLDEGALTAVDLPAEGGGLVEIAVPPCWAADSVARAAAWGLPGKVGVLVLAWGDPRAAAAEGLEVALAILDTAVGRRQAEEQMADLLARVDNAQQLAHMGDYDWHIASDTNRWSDQLYRIYGHEPQSFNASYERFLAHIHPEDRERIQAIHQHAYATGEPYQMIERIIRPDGEVRYLSSNGQVVRGPDGNPQRMRGTCIDITERVLAEQEREHAAARFRALVESCPDAILVLDGDGRVVQANGRAADLLAADSVGHCIAEMLSPADLPGDAVTGTGLDGRALCLDVTVAALCESEDTGLRAAYLRDATPRLRAEALAVALREAQLRRRQALEINDNIVQGLTSAVLTMDRGDISASVTYLERTLAAARRMMDDWLNPLNGGEFQLGDLVRTAPSRLDDPPARIGLSGAIKSAEGSHRVLVADDNEDVRELLVDQLESLGYDVVGQAADGEEAVRIAAALRPEVVLLDLSMPRMSGLEAIPLILQAVPDVRVIVISGFGNTNMAEKALAAGAAHYVEKGLRMDLAGVIEEVLKAA